MLDAKKLRKKLSELDQGLSEYEKLSSKKPEKLTKTDQKALQNLEKQLKQYLTPIQSDSFSADVDLVAQFFGVTARTIQNWCADGGCPHTDHGRYDLKAVFDWWLLSVGQEQDTEEIKDIKAEYWFWQKENSRLKAQEKESLVVKREDIYIAWSERMAEVASGLQALADKIPTLIEGHKKAEQRAIIAKEIWRIRDQFCRTGKFCYSEESTQ